MCSTDPALPPAPRSLTTRWWTPGSRGPAGTACRHLTRTAYHPSAARGAPDCRTYRPAASQHLFRINVIFLIISFCSRLPSRRAFSVVARHCRHDTADARSSGSNWVHPTGLAYSDGIKISQLLRPPPPCVVVVMSLFDAIPAKYKIESSSKGYIT